MECGGIPLACQIETIETVAKELLPTVEADTVIRIAKMIVRRTLVGCFDVGLHVLVRCRYTACVCVRVVNSQGRRRPSAVNSCNKSALPSVHLVARHQRQRHLARGHR